MSDDSRSLDDLDRLAFRLTRVVRQQQPHLNSQGFTLVDLEERLLPFRETRREMANGGADSWERVMLRLVAGERNIVASDPALRDAALQALTQPSPTLALIRRWSNSVLFLSDSEGARDVRIVTSAGHDHTHPTQGCRYCGGHFPVGRRMTYCPHCGLDLTKRQCPACSTELDCGWRFCVTCGRGAEADADETREPANDSDIPTLLAQRAS